MAIPEIKYPGIERTKMKRRNRTMRKSTAKQDRGGIREVKRSLTAVQRAGKQPAAAAHFGALSLPVGLPQEPRSCSEPTPVWLAALVAVNCRAHRNTLSHEVCWQPIGGRALYTNYGRYTETIEPLGVNVPAGGTLAVHWSPGETAYTLEVYSPEEKCA